MPGLIRCCLPVLYLTVLPWIVLSAEEDEPLVKERDPAKLVALLENGDFNEREEAGKLLLKMDSAVVRPLLENALKASTVPDFRALALRLLEAYKKSMVRLEVYDRNGQPMPGLEGTFSPNANADLEIIQGGIGIRVQGFGRGQPNPAKEPPKITSDEKGVFQLEGLKPGSTQISIGLKNADWDVSSMNPFNQQLQIKQGVTRLLAIAIRRGGLNGKVLSADKNAPLDGADVLLESAGQPEMDEEESMVRGLQSQGLKATTDAKGEFKFEPLPAGSYRLKVRSEHYRLAKALDVEIKENETLNLTTPLLAENVTAKLGGFKFKIQDVDGQPLKKSKVYIGLYNAPEGGESAKFLRQMQLRMWGRGNGGNGGGMNNPEKETNEDGEVEFPGLKPGRYLAQVEQATGPTLFLPVLQIEEGKTTALPTLRFPASGSISGRLVRESGEGVQQVEVFAIQENDPMLAVFTKDWNNVRSMLYMRMQRGRAMQVQSEDYVRTNQSGYYELKGLAPGSYLLWFGLRGEYQNGGAIAGGITVKEGEKTEAPKFTLPGSKTETGEVLRVQGRVVGPDGQGLNAQIQLFFKQGNSWGSQAQGNGSFDFSTNGSMGTPTALVAILPGYKSTGLKLDSTQNLNNLVLQMEKIKHGHVSVKVLGPDGQPLQGAVISSQPGTPETSKARVNQARLLMQSGYTGRSNVGPQKVQTGVNGVALLKNLVAGPRSFMAELDGYYLEQPVAAAVQADQEVSVTLQLKPGFPLRGQLTLPPGAEPQKALVGVQFEQGNIARRILELDAQGRFECLGLMPGTYLLSAMYPGLRSNYVSCEINENGTHAPVALKLESPGAVRIDGGPELANAQFSWVKPGSWNSYRQAEQEQAKMFGRSNFIGGYAKADSRGFVEHYGGQQGRCDLLITPHYDTGMYNQPGQTQWIFPNLDVRAPEGGFPGFKKMPPQKIEIPKNLGMAHGILRTKPNSQLQVFVEGAQALATVYHYQNPNLQETLVLSPIPSAISFRKSGAFNLNQLPAGEYKLYIKPQTNHISATEGNELAKKSALEPIKTFTVTAGQNVDLGVIEFDMDIEKTGKPNNEIDIQELLRNYGWDNYGEDADQGDLLRQ